MVACDFIKKETLSDVFSFEFCEIFRNTSLTDHLQATASVKYDYIKLIMKQCKNLTSRPVSKAATNVIYLYNIYIYIIYIQHIYIQYIYTICIYIHIYIYIYIYIQLWRRLVDRKQLFHNYS